MVVCLIGVVFSELILFVQICICCVFSVCVLLSMGVKGFCMLVWKYELQEVIVSFVLIVVCVIFVVLVLLFGGMCMLVFYLIVLSFVCVVSLMICFGVRVWKVIEYSFGWIFVMFLFFQFLFWCYLLDVGYGMVVGCGMVVGWMLDEWMDVG